MEIFVRVAEAGSFSKAAEQLGLANASVTSAIRNLESHLGVLLIHRNTRVSSLTEAGERFLAGAREALDAISIAESTVSDISGGHAGEVSLECPVALGHALIGPLLSGFIEKHPSLRIRCTLTNSPRNMIENNVDVSIRMEDAADSELVQRRLLTAHYVAAASPHFVTRHSIGDLPGDLSEEVCLGQFNPSLRSVRRWDFIREGETVHVRPRGRLTLNSSNTLIHAAVHDAGVIYVLNLFVQPYIDSGQLVPLFEGWETPRPRFFALFRKTRFTPQKVRLLVDYLVESLNRHDIEGIEPR
jgi:LysR family transcriptional regulator for bpeEF and oprC